RPRATLFPYTTLFRSRLSHRAAEGDALFELHRDRLANQLRVELGLLDLLNVDEHLAVRLLLDFLLQLVDFRPLPADDDAGPRGIDRKSTRLNSSHLGT